MSLTDFLNKQTDDEFRTYVLRLLEGDFDYEDNTDLLDGLVLYEGAPGLLRRLYQRLSPRHRETIALAFWDHIQRSEPNLGHTVISPVTLAILDLADPFLSRSSVATDVAMYLEQLAANLHENHAPAPSVMAVHLAALNMGETFDVAYWESLAKDYGEDAYGITLSGLLAISVDSAFEWLKSVPPSPRLLELVKSHIPALYKRARKKVSLHLSDLVTREGAWTGSERDKLIVYCESRNIPLSKKAKAAAAVGGSRASRALIPISNAGFPAQLSRASADLLKSVPSALSKLDAERQVAILTTLFGEIAGWVEFQTRNGRNETREMLGELLRASNKSNDLMPGVNLLRAKSLAWRDIVHSHFDEATGVIVRHIADQLDEKRMIHAFVNNVPVGVRYIVARHTQHHEDRVLMRLFKELVEYQDGPRIDIRSASWADTTERRPREPVVRIQADRRSTEEAINDPAVMFGFNGYHVFIRKHWLKQRHQDGEVDNLDLRTKCRLAIDAGVLNAGASRCNLHKEFLAVAGARLQEGSVRRGGPSKRDSERLLERFLSGANKVILAGALHAHMIKEWFVGGDVVQLMGPSDIAMILNHSVDKSKRKATPSTTFGIFEKLYCDFPADLDKGREWTEGCRNVFELIVTFIDEVYSSNEDDRELPGRGLGWAWAIFTFEVLGAEFQLPGSSVPHGRPPGRLHLSFAADPTDAVNVFRYDDFGVGHRRDLGKSGE
jgi:hypothetical protein